MKFIISEHTLYDSEQEMYFTKIGEDCKAGALRFTVWGKTAEQSRIFAENLVTKFEAYNALAAVPEVSNFVTTANVATRSGQVYIELPDVEAVPPFVMVNNTVYVPKQDTVATNLADNAEVSQTTASNNESKNNALQALLDKAMFLQQKNDFLQRMCEQLAEGLETLVSEADRPPSEQNKRLDALFAAFSKAHSLVKAYKLSK